MFTESSMHEFKAPKGRPYRKYGNRALLITGAVLLQVSQGSVMEHPCANAPTFVVGVYH